jgi:hypothetical protein
LAVKAIKKKLDVLISKKSVNKVTKRHYLTTISGANRKTEEIMVKALTVRRGNFKKLQFRDFNFYLI